MPIALFGAIAAFVAASAGVLWLGRSRAMDPGARLGQLGTYSRTTREDGSFGARVLAPSISVFVRPIVALMPQTLVRRATEDLEAAGLSLTPQRFFALVAITGLVLPVLAFVALIGVASFTAAVVLTLASAIAGMVLPFWILRRRVQRRQHAVWRSLPDAFDMITVSVEAGLGLDGALRHVAEKLRGPLSEELAQTLREVGVGRPRREALEAMADRLNLREVTTFVHSIVQTEQLGTSLGRTLRAQTAALRVRRRQRAEEQSRKAPVKMVFPLVLFIMPSFFIVTVGPTFVRLVTYLQGR